MSEICGKNTLKSDTVVSPCLKQIGHEGSCEHYAICNSIGCMCGGLRDRIKQDKEKYERLMLIRKELTLLMREEDSIYEEFKVKP